MDYTGKVLVLLPQVLDEHYRQEEGQLWLALNGFGCRPDVIGRSILCVCLSDGEMARWNRTDFFGVIREESLPQWAKEKLEKQAKGFEPEIKL
ncbi:hypothetical protein [Anaerotruncus rubiinfantis]|uniref:hypothetical protein n=1 Tax=Anaerotruncus rubiinfantis TaxID=1720200 RepID=UPI000A99A088|nr:hypothetical protein [Anaerotruncus rubiinfantis]